MNTHPTLHLDYKPKAPGKWPVRLAITVAVLLLIGVGFHSYWFSKTYVLSAQENPYRLWIDALKPFFGQVYYVGNEGEFSYFRAGAIFPTRYKAPTAKIHLPRTFPLGAAQPYAVTAEMVKY